MPAPTGYLMASSNLSQGEEGFQNAGNSAIEPLV